MQKKSRHQKPEGGNSPPGSNRTLTKRKPVKRFDSEEYRTIKGGYLPHELSCVTHALNMLLLEHLRESGINVVQFRALQVIANAQPISIGDLARDIVIEQSVVSRIINQLVSRDLVEKSRSEVNGKVVNVCLTPEGESLITHLQPIAYTIQADALSVLSEKERKSLTAMLSRIFNHITSPSYAGVLDG
ncbi:MarR family winged helix-turn-helix transcriptional regulator [Parahaliea mediterranea]|uniref:MarR family winged helix-turn-helix transcriptional regulator n=1 Tax=Parahaliea mediterranea TaxID=651086 RepID=UPI000E2EAA3A|nr:MarR family winged helix-turn-helix transcriptional regulator [Parahaliea mediterranea]